MTFLLQLLPSSLWASLGYRNRHDISIGHKNASGQMMTTCVAVVFSSALDFGRTSTVLRSTSPCWLLRYLRPQSANIHQPWGRSQQRSCAVRSSRPPYCILINTEIETDCWHIETDHCTCISKAGYGKVHCAVKNHASLIGNFSKCLSALPNVAKRSQLALRVREKRACAHMKLIVETIDRDTPQEPVVAMVAAPTLHRLRWFFVRCELILHSCEQHMLTPFQRKHSTKAASPCKNFVDLSLFVLPCLVCQTSNPHGTTTLFLHKAATRSIQLSPCASPTQTHEADRYSYRFPARSNYRSLPLRHGMHFTCFGLCLFNCLRLATRTNVKINDAQQWI